MRVLRLGQGAEREPEGALFLTQILHPLPAKSGKQQCAKVISIASIDGLSVNPLETYSYSASKAGLIHLTRRMALTLIKHNIVANCIAPGAFASDMNTEARDHADELARRIPAGRIGREDDIAAAAIYLASRAGDYIVGEPSWWTAAGRTPAAETPASITVRARPFR
jgi:NAD(P)-dependent dehydrogenase (short-subunit alcohol dehydrogenase family)